MTEQLSKDVNRAIDLRLKLLDQELRDAGHSSEERDIVLAGLREHIANDTCINSQNVQQRLDDMIGDVGSFEDPKGSEGDARFLSRLAILTSIGVCVGIAFGAPLASLFGADGGAVMVLIAIIGFPLSFVLSWMTRRSKLGHTALVITLLGSALMAILLAMVFLFPET